jgi:hypothetical protein
MTTTATHVTTPAVANGLTPIPFDFQGTGEAEVGVLLDGVELTYGSDFTVAMLEDGTGTVTPLSDWGAGDVVIFSNPSLQQPTRFERFGPWYPDQMNTPLDRLARSILAFFRRGLRVTPGSEIDEIPGATARASRFMGFDSLGAIALRSVDELATLLYSPIATLLGPGMKGDPGGNAMAVGLFTAVSGLTISAGTDRIRTSGHSTVGWGGADYINDPAIDAAYVAANPLTAVTTLNGRHFRLDTDQFLTIAMFGALGDGTDDAPAIAAAVDMGHWVHFTKPPVDYNVLSPQSVTVTRPVLLDMGKHPITFAAAANFTITAPQVAAGRTLALDAARYDTAIKLDDAAGIEAGDIIVVNTTVPAETAWSYGKKDALRVKSVDTGTGDVELAGRLNFAYTTADAGLSVVAYRPQPLTMLHPHIIAADDVTMFEFKFLENPKVEAPVMVGPVGFDPVTDDAKQGFRLWGCVGGTFTGVHAVRMSYPILPVTGARGIRVYGIIAEDCRHAVAPSDWAADVKVFGLRATDCWGAIDGHPSFDVEYEDFDVQRDRGLSNLRVVRGALRKGKYHTLATDADFGPYYHNLTLGAGASYLYDDADFEIDGLELLAPNRTIPTIRIDKGRVVRIDGYSGAEDTLSVSNGTLNSVGLVIWGPNNRIGGRSGPKRSHTTGIRCPIRVMQPPRLDAYLDTGVYHIDPHLEMVDQSNQALKCYGRIAKMLAGSPQTLVVRIHTSAFGNLDNPTYIHGKLRLRVKARHSNAGEFAHLEKVWNFRHKATATSGLSFPLTPVFTSSPSGQTNESALTLGVSNVSQAGVTELGATSDFYVEFDVDIAMALTSPLFDVDYELELEAQQ